MPNTHFDIVIIGGGIHGAGVAQAGAAAGYSVLLLEQNSIASGTSSKSSKLIHGGLRYLESAQFSLVRECLQERYYLLKNAPHLVEMKPFFLPVYKQTSRRPYQLRLGLSLYALLSGMGKYSYYRQLPKKEWADLDGLSEENLQRVFQYWDAQTDDKLLTRAVLASACEMGAESQEHTTLLSAKNDNSQWQIKYESENREQEVTSSIIVNAAGPWVNDVLHRIAPEETGMAVDLVQGSHIVVDGETQKGIYYLESPSDQRAIFVMPWYGRTMVGTTERIYTGDPADVKPQAEEVAYLISAVRHYFPKYSELTPEKIQQAFAGLRVLPRKEGAAFSRPRETSFYQDKSAHSFSIYGGKLTAYRATSARLIKLIEAQISPKEKVADTRFLQLPDA